MQIPVLTYFIAYMQTKMVENAQKQQSKVSLEVQKKHKSRKNVEHLKHIKYLKVSTLIQHKQTEIKK